MAYPSRRHSDAAALVRTQVPHEGWVCEEKVDGYRMVAYKNGGRVRLVSRHGRYHTARLSGLATALRDLDSSSTLIQDGEVPVYHHQLVSRFEWLRNRSPPGLATPPLFMVFDCLYPPGKDLNAGAHHARRTPLRFRPRSYRPDRTATDHQGASTRHRSLRKRMR